jgi:hypothetical protein
MKKTILFFVLVLALFNFCVAQEWFTSLKVAKKLAQVQNKMLFVMWENSTNYPYPILLEDDKGKLEVTDLFKDERVNRIIWNYFVPVKINESQYAELSHQVKQKRGSKYFTKLIDDSIKIMDVNGYILNNDPFVPVEDFWLFVKHYALDTSFIKYELISYSKNKNFTTSFILAAKYLDLAIFADKDIKFEIIQLSNIYFDEAINYLLKSDLNNKMALLQKRDLLKIKSYLILNKPKKALRHLKKIEIITVDNINQSLFSFLNYTAFMLLKDEEKADLWKSKISLVDLKKAKLIINKNS